MKTLFLLIPILLPFSKWMILSKIMTSFEFSFLQIFFVNRIRIQDLNIFECLQNFQNRYFSRHFLLNWGNERQGFIEIIAEMNVVPRLNVKIMYLNFHFITRKLRIGTASCGEGPRDIILVRNCSQGSNLSFKVRGRSPMPFILHFKTSNSDLASFVLNSQGIREGKLITYPPITSLSENVSHEILSFSRHPRWRRIAL